MNHHNYNFNGGEELSRIGASWLVSYLYCLHIDVNHKNWEKISNVVVRKNRCIRCKNFHQAWIQEIINMDPKNLDRNHIGLTGAEVIEMAKKLLPILTNGGAVQINSTAIFNFHITYQENMKLKELSDLLNTVNLSVNDYYRDCGIGNSELNSHAAVVSKVESGSIWFELVFDIFSELTVAILTEYILRRVWKTREKQNDNANNLHIEAGDNNTINIYINNPKA